MFVTRGDKHHLGGVGHTHEEVEAAVPGHVDIEKHDIQRRRLEEAAGLGDILGDADDLDFRMGGEELPHHLVGTRLVVDKERGDHGDVLMSWRWLPWAEGIRRLSGARGDQTRPSGCRS